MVVTVKPNKIPELEKSYRAALRTNKDVSKNWMISSFKALQKMSHVGIMGFSKTLSSHIDIGQMAFFLYDAKYKDELEHWDKFPLSLCIGYTQTGIMALNFHYLPVRARFVLLEKLLDFVNNDKMDKNTRIKASYEMLNAASRYSDFLPCLHQYRLDHMRSQFSIVQPENWHLALGIPAQRFVQGGRGNKPGKAINWTRKVWGS